MLDNLWNWVAAIFYWRVKNLFDWMNDHGALAYWAQALAILFTGVVAVRAGRKAFKGSKAQADATLKQIEANERLYEANKADKAEKLRRDKEAEIKMAATALASEMSIQIRSLADLYRRANGGFVAETWMSWIRGSKSVFRQNPYIVSKFPPYIADDIIQFYGMIETELAHFDEYDRRYGEPSGDNSVAMDNAAIDAHNLAVRVRNNINVGRRAVDYLSEISGRQQSMRDLNIFVEAAFNNEPIGLDIELYSPGLWLEE